PVPEPLEELPVPPPSEPEEAEPAAPLAEAQLSKGLVPPSPAPEREEPSAPPPEPQVEEFLVPPPSELPREKSSTPVPFAPYIEEPPAPPLAEAYESSVAPPPEEIEELSGPPPSEPEEEEPSVPALSEQGGEAPSVPPPSELHREEEEPSALPSWEQQRAEPAAMPVPEQPFISPNMQTGWFSRPRLIFLALSLLPLIALLFLFRAYFLTGPSTPKAMVSPQAKATASEKVVPPANHREEKAPVAAVPPATQPVSPVSKEPVSAELGKKAQDQPDKEKSATIAALPPPEKKMEIPAVKELKPADLRKTVKESLVSNGFSNLGVLVDEKKGVSISGNVKNVVQKNKVIEIVNSMGLSMPADYSNL
ncbi:MAG: hypothetical protein Q8L43_08360, partial [Deltaproteobacteria bacterium]|nr:hypothetical protein [Deltaproteobacteria bacterium]